ncbi:ComEA family DNA-binding protein [Acidobacteriota bacterium]
MKKITKKSMAFSLVFAFLFTMIVSLQTQAGLQKTEKKVNINTATVTELQSLPRIGAKVAQRIVDFRNEHGQFKKIEELMKVKGIGEKTFEQLKDLITVGSTSTSS